MTQLFEKSIETLELPRVLALLANEAVTEEGKERCLALRPVSVQNDVSRLQKQTTAAFDLLVKHGTPSLSGVKPVAAALQRADRGGALNTRELLDIAQVLRCARNVHEYGAAISGASLQTVSWKTRSPAPSSARRRSLTRPPRNWPTSGGTSGRRRGRCGTCSTV